MKRKYKSVLRVLALIMAFVCLGVSLAPASFAFAGVLDPAAWLYPIWSMYGAQNGVNVTTTGNADFTIAGMTTLWNEYQASRVSSGLQQAAQTITDFVNGVKGFVSVIAGAVTGGSLNTKLMLGAGIVGALDAFWNWIITEKLDGTSVDSTDFDSSSGNIMQSASAIVLPYFGTEDVSNSYITSHGLKLCDWATHTRWVYGGYVNPVEVPVYAFYYDTGSNYKIVWCSPYHIQIILAATMDMGTKGWRFDNNILNTASNLYYTEFLNIDKRSDLAWFIPEYPSLQDGLLALASPVSGSLTIAPDAGVDVLGFPDSEELNYVPSDAVIPWNIPYDSTKDTDAYIDAAFADAVSGDLTIGEEGEVIQPVPGVGPVGDYVAVGLGDVFPFCIPFDIYDFVSALAADPVAPSFTAELAFPEVVGGTQYVELDFDTPTFNQLASILRTMELLAFIVGLALLTRSMFIRG